MKTILYDLETDGLLDEVTKIHCLVAADTDTGEILAFHDDPSVSPRDGSVKEGIAYLGQADRTAGHNILGYDAPVLRKLGLVDRRHRTQDRSQMFDTLVLSRLVWSDRKELDFRLLAEERIKPKNVGRLTLESWGDRFGFAKGDYDGGWDTFSQDMLDYCIRDVELNLKLYRVIEKRLPDFEAQGWTTAQVEHIFAGQLHDQQERGQQLSREEGEKLLKHLHLRRGELAEKIQEEFPPTKAYYKINKKTGRRSRRKCEVTGKMLDHKLVPFNPGSRQQLALRLRRKHGWVPKDLTDKGNPVMAERVLLDLAQVYSEVGLVAEWLIVNSRISILEDGPTGYFRLCDEKDILHGRVTHIGTVTHRCTHSRPNTGNVTSIRKPYGLEMRKVFVPFKGYIQAGFDADGIEQRMLAHELHPYDGGKYARAVLEGTKEDGTDPHSMNAAAVSKVVESTRDKAKEAFYAYLYGAQDARLGKIYGKGSQTGKQIRAALEKGITGMPQLMRWLAIQRKENGGSIVSLDGRRVGVRYEHALLNTKLQTNGAVVMKWVPVMLESILPAFGIGRLDWLQTGHIHDELQGSLRPHLKDNFKLAVDEAFRLTSEALQLKVPVTGSVEFGTSWADTH